MSEKANEENSLKNAAAFFSGLAIYQLSHFAISAGNFAASRFRIPSSLVGLYINRFIISYRISTFAGNTLMTIYDIGVGKHMDKVSTVLRWSDAAGYLLALFIFWMGGDQGYITFYYWFTVSIGLLNGLSFVSNIKIGSKQMSYFLVAFPTSGIFVSLFHIIFLEIFNRFRLSNTYYWLIVWQKILAIVIAVVSAILWSAAYNGTDTTSTGGGGGGGDNNDKLKLSGAWSPILMIALGYSLQNAFYPSIAPFKLIGAERGYKIGIAVLIISAMPPLAIVALKNWKITPSTKWTGGNQYWHCAWVFFFVEVTCALLFLIGLHYPYYSVSQELRNNIWVLAVFTISYDLSAQVLRVVGSNGASRQADANKDNSKVDTFATCLYSFTQVVFAFMGDGYLRIYSQYESDLNSWPTAHYGRLRSFWFWYWSTTKVACKAMKSAFSTDVRAEIQTNKEFLFIVYDDAPPECEDHLFDLPFIHRKEESPDNYSFKGAYIFH
ncbi:hypothetical protein BEWA_020570 [Theileria equi strain WA]|uniref:Uncharacterized protein n=1 Tax=Theileria equi strain WA TaxID=1537102 RepID=L0AUH6_THEEQ|nr:hypothetical protein BEWA_020570 [Theileria equi strain WA]AFZ79210.1 hypothetical protein BEWA_020570 [Theileria equi strain WA]|eukprot:XP_004828876.1 hypothetical protein BEWA_020570 [Theileria equi strain WA]